MTEKKEYCNVCAIEPIKSLGLCGPCYSWAYRIKGFGKRRLEEYIFNTQRRTDRCEARLVQLNNRKER